MTSNLEQQALERREKLKGLKRKFEENGANPKQPSLAETLPKPKFRSYKPQDSTLKQQALPPINPADVKQEVKDLLNLAKSEVVIDELDITKLTPKQPDWDLKRDVAKKLEKLERRTQKAMAELIWEKLKAKKDLADIPDQ